MERPPARYSPELPRAPHAPELRAVGPHQPLPLVQPVARHALAHQRRDFGAGHSASRPTTPSSARGGAARRALADAGVDDAVFLAADGARPTAGARHAAHRGAVRRAAAPLGERQQPPGERAAARRGHHGGRRRLLRGGGVAGHVAGRGEGAARRGQDAAPGAAGYPHGGALPVALARVAAHAHGAADVHRRAHERRTHAVNAKARWRTRSSPSPAAIWDRRTFTARSRRTRRTRLVRAIKEHGAAATRRVAREGASRCRGRRTSTGRGSEGPRWAGDLQRHASRWR